jgi:hypothetical protein
MPVLGRAPSATYDELPCFRCAHQQAQQAIAEIAKGYLAAKRGEPSRAAMNAVLPQLLSPEAACDRDAGCVKRRSPRALDGTPSEQLSVFALVSTALY